MAHYESEMSELGDELAKSVGKLIAQGKDVTPKQVSNALQAARSESVYSDIVRIVDQAS